MTTELCQESDDPPKKRRNLGKCGAPGCDRPAKTVKNPLCNMHWLRIKKRGCLEPELFSYPFKGAELTQEGLKKVLDYDPETGIFTRKIRTSKSVRIGDVAGRISNHGYVVISVFAKQRLAHRLAFLWMTGRMPRCVDHINGIKTDNAWSNLREATHSQNNTNVGLKKNNPIGLKGVYEYKNKTQKRFQSKIQTNGKVVSLGCFYTAEEAHAAYCEAAVKYHGEFARTS